MQSVPVEILDEMIWTGSSASESESIILQSDSDKV
jgi:hypothetical protein